MPHYAQYTSELLFLPPLPPALFVYIVQQYHQQDSQDNYQQLVLQKEKYIHVYWEHWLYNHFVVIDKALVVLNQ
jgi:hypothetical protein